MSLTPSSSYIPGHRRTWDKTEFEIKAQERLAAEKEAFDIKRGIIKPPKFPKVQRELLKPREFKLDLESKVGKQVVINKTTPSAESGGYYCNICDCVESGQVFFIILGEKNIRILFYVFRHFYNILNVYDHHYLNLDVSGFSMRVKKSTVDEVRERLALKKIEKDSNGRDDEEERQRDLREEEAKISDMKRQQRERQKEQIRKRSAKNTLDEFSADPELLSIMGIGNFSSKQQHKKK
ncbi:U1-type domain-containing protein [Meloidogyne graminicola]|uniref:U1-type domain-containing protein n=1 Tax=Meloidogyne graminicola TaxID=189291 RepID=A0A8S9ZGB4_9BILA|nr:U1-type domain-containing protein [Meloidogyne graminicola]